MRSRSLGHRAPLLWLVLPLMAGIAAGRLAPLGMAASLTVAGGGAAVALALARRGPAAWATAIVAGAFLAGAVAYRLEYPTVAGWRDLPPREATLTIRVVRVFPRGEDKAAGIGVIVAGRGATAELVRQRVYFSGRQSSELPPLLRGAVVRGRGLLVAVPADPPAASFDRYLADAAIGFRLTGARVLAVERPASRYQAFLERSAEQLKTWLGSGIAGKRPELTAVYRAMMLGQKQELSDEQNAWFMHSGTMHLFAINGLHIGMVAITLHALLGLLRCPRPLAALVTLALLWFDVDTTGASPSAVRAFLLVACYESGFVLRRRANGVAALAAAALLILLREPVALFSASFQMSYGVVLTILCFALPFADWLQERCTPFRDKPKVTWSRVERLIVFATRKTYPVLAIGVAATLVSAITGPAFFGVISGIGFVANLILVPLALLVIVAGVASIVAGALGVLGVCGLFNHAALVVLVVMEALIRQAERIPGGWWPAHWRVDWTAPAALAVLLTSVLVGYACEWRRFRIGWWVPFAVVALVTVTGVQIG